MQYFFWKLLFIETVIFYVLVNSEGVNAQILSSNQTCLHYLNYPVKISSPKPKDFCNINPPKTSTVICVKKKIVRQNSHDESLKKE